MSDARYLNGLHAIVTGGGRGIGAAVADALAALGANLTLMGRDQQRLDDHAEHLAQAHGVEIAAVRCDVSDGMGRCTRLPSRDLGAVVAQPASVG